MGRLALCRASPPRGRGKSAQGPGQVRPGADASPPRGQGKFAQGPMQVRPTRTLSSKYTRTVQFCLIFMSKNVMYVTHITQFVRNLKSSQILLYLWNKPGKQKSTFGTASARKLWNKIWFPHLFLLENNIKLDNWKSLLECMLVCLCSQVILSILHQIS